MTGIPRLPAISELVTGLVRLLLHPSTAEDTNLSSFVMESMQPLLDDTDSSILNPFALRLICGHDYFSSWSYKRTSPATPPQMSPISISPCPPYFLLFPVTQAHPHPPSLALMSYLLLKIKIVILCQKCHKAV
jgi:hypothetical protein